MKIKTILTVIFLTLLFGECKKNNSNTNTSNAELLSRIDTRLDNQKKATSITNEARNIESLRNGLDYSTLHIESSNNDQVIIIPIKERFKSAHKIDRNITVNLVLVLNEYGSFKSGNILLYEPARSGTDELSLKDISNLFNGKPSFSDGSFQIGTVSGKFLFEYKYTNGKELSFKIIKAGKDVVGAGKREDDICIDWYAITNGFNSSGNLVTEHIEYLGASCASDQCTTDPTMLQYYICGQNQGSGPSTVLSQCLTTQTTNFNNESTGATAAATDVSFDIGDIDIPSQKKYKNPSWICLTGYNNGWSLVSHENGVIQYDNTAGAWKWLSMSHCCLTMTGSTLPGVSIVFGDGVGTPAIQTVQSAADGALSAGMTVDLYVTFTFNSTCSGAPFVNVPPLTVNYTSHHGKINWGANP